MLRLSCCLFLPIRSEGDAPRQGVQMLRRLLSYRRSAVPFGVLVTDRSPCR